MTRNQELFERAQQRIPGGVNSPVRAFKAVGGNPPFIQSAAGSHLRDADGNEYLDYVCSWGPMILGHAHPEVVEAVQQAAARGTSYGAPTEGEVLLAEKICSFFPSIEKVRLVNSGTEATLSAVRLARAFTGRDKVLKFEGCYHGHSDSFLVKAGSGLATLGIAGSPGIPRSFAELTVPIPFNDVPALEEALNQHSSEVAAIIVEPVPANMGVVLPRPGFLEQVLRLGEENGSLVIFDEVITGFRLARGGAQEYFSLSAPLTCLGKIVGGGLPIGAYGGRSDVMELVAPSGPVYQAGTLSGNPIAVAAGLKTLQILERDQPYPELNRRTSQLCEGIAAAAAAHGIDLQVQRVGSLFTLFFSPAPVDSFETAARCDSERFGRFFRHMLAQGIYLAASQFEACFMSTAHSPEDLAFTLEKAEAAFRELAQTG